MIAAHDLFTLQQNLNQYLMKISAEIQLIRNATLLLGYAGRNILVDPMFAPAGAFGSISGKSNSPMVDLPIPVQEILSKTEMVLVTHTHRDHFDPSASASIDKTVDLFFQPADRDFFQNEGFLNAKVIDQHIDWKGISIFRTNGQHGSEEVLSHMGTVSGFILKAENQPTVYIVGDSIYTDEVKENINAYQPDYIIVNAGGAVMPGYEKNIILMDEKETIALLNDSGEAKVIAVHMEAIDHCRTTRTSLRNRADEFLIPNQRLLIPEDGQTIILG